MPDDLQILVSMFPLLSWDLNFWVLYGQSNLAWNFTNSFIPQTIWIVKSLLTVRFRQGIIIILTLEGCDLSWYILKCKRLPHLIKNMYSWRCKFIWLLSETHQLGKEGQDGQKCFCIVKRECILERRPLSIRYILPSYLRNTYPRGVLSTLHSISNLTSMAVGRYSCHSVVQ